MFDKGALIKYDRQECGRDLDGILNISQDFSWGMNFVFLLKKKYFFTHFFQRFTKHYVTFTNCSLHCTQCI